MGNLGMGSNMYVFDPKKTSDLVGECEHGNYSFGYVNADSGKFTPKYVGRSDTNLAREINARFADLVTNGNKEYDTFKFDCAESVRDAYIKECHNYHDFKSHIDNQIHPAHPGDSYPNLYYPIIGCEHSENGNNEE